jgi:hypothetical protein
MPLYFCNLICKLGPYLYSVYNVSSQCAVHPDFFSSPKTTGNPIERMELGSGHAFA